jgi:hypothetical protein
MGSLAHLNKGDLVYVRFNYQEPIPGMFGVYRNNWELEPAHLVSIGVMNICKVRFVRENILMYVEIKDLEAG